MILETAYLRPNITIETEVHGARTFYVYNYQGTHYRVFNGQTYLNEFMRYGAETWLFDTAEEKDLETYFNSIEGGFIGFSAPLSIP